MSMAVDERADRANMLSPYHRYRLTRAGSALRQGTVEDAVVMFADLSGFSRMSAQMVANNARSAEDLARFLNELVDRAAEIIESHGGAITGYAGDATIAIWPVSERQDEAAVTACALACGLALQVALRDLRDPALAPVRLKVNVDSGPVWMADVAMGKTQRQLHLAGPVLEGLAELGTLAAPGEVVLPVATHARLGLSSGGYGRGACRVVTSITSPPDPMPYPPASLPNLPVDVYVPRWLTDLLAQTDRCWLAEFRSASVLFASITGLSALTPDAARRMEQAFSALGAELDAAEGRLLQIMNDDKGLTIMCAWGLSGNTHEDDAARAVMTGQALLKLLSTQGLGCSLGVASGKVFAGFIGGRSGAQYSLIGDPVNRAAALSQLGAQRLLVDSETACAAGGRFEFTARQEIAIKGQMDPKPVFSDPVERRSLQSEAHAFVGRERELALISAKLATARASGATAPIIHVESIAGMGKSRLLAELRRRIDGDGLRVVVGAGDSLRRGSSLQLWRGVFRSLLPAAAPDRVQALNRLAVHDHNLCARLPLLAQLIDIVIPETSLTRSLDTATRGRLTVETAPQFATLLLRNRADLLIVEDAHWLDSLSWQVLAEVRRRLPELGLLLLSRPFDVSTLPPEASAMLDSPFCTTVALAGFTRSEAAALAASVLRVDDVPDDIAGLIDRRCEGIPLFIKELTRLLQERGILRNQRGRCVVTHADRAPADIELPDGIEGAVAERISTLNAATQLTLKSAAVAGRDFDLPQLAAIRPACQDGDTLQDQVQAILRTGLVETAGSDCARFRFHHALIQKTAHDLLVQEQKVELHGAAARWLEARDDKSRAAPLIAHHWAEAGDHLRAMDWYERATLAALADNAPAEIVTLTTRIRHHAAHVNPPPDRAQRGHWLFLEGNAQKQLGNYRACVDRLREAIDLFGRSAPRKAPTAMLGALRELARLKLGRRTGSWSPDARRQALMVAEAYHASSEITYLWGERAQTLHGVLHALNLCEAMGEDSPIMAKILMATAMVGLSAPWAIDARAYRDRALAMCIRLDDDLTWSWVLLVAGVFETSLGDMRAALSHLERCPEICERTGEWQNWRSAMGSIGNALRIDGRPGAARDVQHRLMAQAVDSGNILAQVWAQSGLSKSLTLLGAFDELKDCLARFAQLAERQAHAGDRNLDICLRLGQASADVAAGRDATAHARVAEIVGLIDSLANPAVYNMDTVTMFCDVIEVLRVRGCDPATLTAALRANLRFASRLARRYPGARSKALCVRGDQAAMAGHLRRAARFWEAARTEAAGRSLRLDEAQACLRLARRTNRSEGAALERRAQAILQELQLPCPPLWSAQAG